MKVVLYAWKSDEDLLSPWSAKTLTCPLLEVCGAETSDEALNELRGMVLCAVGLYKTVPTNVDFAVSDVEHLRREE